MAPSIQDPALAQLLRDLADAVVIAEPAGLRSLRDRAARVEVSDE